MIDIEAINNTIEHLEQSDTTTTTICNKLASLYIVREYFTKPKQDTVEAELADILPSYQNYIDIKRRYQLKELDLDRVEDAMLVLCHEIYDFIHSLYCNTESSVERKAITSLIDQLDDFV